MKMENNTVVNMSMEQKVAKMARVGSRIMDLRDEIKTATAQLEGLKDTMAILMKDINVGEFVIPLGADEEIVIRVNNRSVKSLDKSELAKKTDTSMSDINYATISKFVEDSVLSSNDVEKAHKNKEYSFITVATRQSTQEISK